jgi:hypothetical protein
MFQIRVTAPDGTTTTHPFNGMQCTVGRAQGNDIVLDGTAVSSLHCAFELSATGCVLRERGSTNGTWVNGNRVQDAVAITERDRIYVGSFLVEIERVSIGAQARPAAHRPAQLDGPILRTASASERSWREQLGRFGRYADEWERKGRPSTLTLRAEELSRARKWLQQAKGDRQYEVTRLMKEFVEASEKAASGRMIKRVLAIAGGVIAFGGLVTLAIVLWPEPDPEPVVAEGETDSAAEAGEDDESSGGGFEQALPPQPEGDMEEVGNVDQPIKHAVIPFETLGDIATRYGVTVDDVAGWNYLNPDEPTLETGKELLIEAPKRRPIPQTKVDYEVEPGEASWTKLADRFGVAATRLEAYNAGVELKAGATIAVWIDPKPYEPRDPNAKIPDYDYGTEAQSVGRTNAGSLSNGLQLPESPLYERRSPHLMYGSAYTIEHLTEGIAAFRRDVAYDGALNLSDISKKGGGRLEPHKSHQAGRDIDIWLPTLKGVYKVKYFKSGGSRDRRPLFEEVDWYALWGLVRALIQTGAVEEIYLDWIYQEFVYRAAVNMGATPEELDEWIQWPRPRSSSKGVFRHSKDHLSHIHVRFKCAPWEKSCDGRRGKGED